MKLKWVFSAILAAFLVLSVISRSEAAINTRQIDILRDKEVLDSEDRQVIDNFLAEAVQELVRTRDFTSIAKTRTIILSRQSTQGQYAEQFSESSYKHISSGLKQAGGLPEEQKFKVILNLLILIDGLEDTRLTDLAIELLKSENKIIRYWAVRCVTNSTVIGQLSPGETGISPLVLQIIGQLKKLVESGSPEILALMARFAVEVNGPQGDELLGRIVDVRMERYVDWTVEYELVDGAILKLLYSKIAAEGSSKVAFAPRFAQLYSYVFQRYIKGQEVLSSTEKNYLVSVLVETEDKCLGKLLERPQTVIKRAIERGDYQALLQEHNRLLGDETKRGELVLRLEFDYGTNAAGRKLTAPLALPDPPEEPTPLTELGTG